MGDMFSSPFPPYICLLEKFSDRYREPMLIWVYIVVFPVMTPCSLERLLPKFRRNLLPSSSGQKSQKKTNGYTFYKRQIIKLHEFKFIRWLMLFTVHNILSSSITLIWIQHIITTTHSLIPCRTTLPEKLTLARLLNKLPDLRWNQRFSTMLNRAHYWTTWIQSTLFHPI